MTSRSSERRSDLKTSKKPYESPKLISYGSVKKITGMAKRRRTSDGGTRRT